MLSMPPTFALLSPCGYGNLGDAAIQDAMIANIRSRHPNARILGITLNPRDTEQRHGINSFPIAAGARHNYGGTSAPAGQAADSVYVPGARHTLGRMVSSRLRRILGTIARSVVPERLKAWLRTLQREWEHSLDGFRLLRSVDKLIISGGGQLDEFWGGPWGHPWALLKWALLARFRNARVQFLSVGFGRLDSRWSRVLCRLALSLADYRSFRDAGSRDLMRRAGFDRMDDPIVPDLAYSRPGGRQRGALAEPIRTVGISPIAYCHPDLWARRDARVYESYLERLTQVAIWLLETEHRLVFFASGGSDHRVIDEMIARLSSRAAPAQLAQIRVASVATVDGFLEQAAAVDIVVASRLHGLLLSHLAGTPTNALSFDRKVDVLMAEMDHQAYALNIDSFNLADFQRAFAALQGTWLTAREQLQTRQREYRGLLQRQYDRVLGTPHGHTPFSAQQMEPSSCQKQASLLSA